MKSNIRRNLSLGASAVAIVMTFSAPATAASTTWTGYSLKSCGILCVAADSDSWFKDSPLNSNWSNGVPDSTTTVNIDTPVGRPLLPAPFAIPVLAGGTGAAGALNVGTATGGSGTLYIGAGAANPGTLNVTNATTIGQVAGSTGYIWIRDNGDLATGKDLIVGDLGSGRLDVAGTSDTTGKVIIGNQSSASGVVNVASTGSMTNHGTLTVGETGDGTLSIDVGGRVETDGQVVIADRGNSTGTVTVDGTMINHDTLTVGEDGDASLTVDAGGKILTAGTTVIADRSSSTSSVDVAGGRMKTKGELIVGEDGNATLTISDGGRVYDSIAIAGDRRGSSGVVTVTGAGSRLVSRDDLVVGYDGNGTLNLTNGGTASVSGGDGVLHLGEDRLSQGTLNIGGANPSGPAAAAGTLNATQVVFGDGTDAVNFNHTDSDYHFEAGFTGTGTVNQIAGSTVLDGDSSLFTGTTNVTGGVLTVNNTLASGINVASSGTLRVGYEDGTTGDITGDVANDGRVQINRSDDYSYDGAISGTGSVQQIGSGTTTLTGENSYTGGTRIRAGTLQIGDGGTSGSIVGNVSVDRNGTLAFDRSDDVTFDGTIRGRGQIDQIGSGTTILTGNSNRFSGDTNITAGTLQIGNGGTSGSLGGDINVGAEGTLAYDRSDTSRVRGTLSGSGTIVQAGSGTAILTGDSRDFAGKTSITGGTLQLGDGGWRGWLGGDVDVGDAGTLAFDRRNTDTFTGVITGTGNVVQEGAGRTVLTGDSLDFAGTTTISRGTLQLGDGGESGWISGDIVNDGKLAFDRSDANTFAGTISGTGHVVQQGDGVTILAGENSYTGGTAVRAGTLQIGDGGTSGSIVGDVWVGQNGTFAFDRSDDVTFDGTILGHGQIDQDGSGETILTGDSHLFSGNTSVTAGALSVNGQLGGTLDVLDGGTLKGSGTVGSTTVRTGATIAPGNSIGTLTIAGNLAQEAGSVYAVELKSTGESDLLNVSGTATLADGAVLNVTKLDSAQYQLGQSYNVLTAGDGVTGHYVLTGDTAVSAFYQLQIDDDANGDTPAHTVRLDVAQNRQFQEAATTRNQIAAATAAQSLKTPALDNALFRAIAYLPSDEDARRAFDQISGENHVSARSALIEDSRYVREAALDRLRVAFNGVASTGSGQNSQTTSGGAAIWGQGFGSWGHLNGDGNASRVTRSIGGFMLGADAAVGDALRLGAYGSYSQGSFDTKSLSSSGKSDNYQVGVYAGGQFGQLGLRAGGAYTWHKIHIDRDVAIGGPAAFSDSLTSKYDGHTAQIFGELGYRIDTARAAFEPFAGLAYVDVKTDGFTETGNEAVLTAGKEGDSVTYGTLGLRASTIAAAGITAHATLGWRHAFDDKLPTTTFRLAGSDDFTVAGVPIARNVALIEAGLDTPVTSNVGLGLSYSGQLGDGVQDHGIRANATVRF